MYFGISSPCLRWYQNESEWLKACWLLADSVSRHLHINHHLSLFKVSQPTGRAGYRGRGSLVVAVRAIHSLFLPCRCHYLAQLSLSLTCGPGLLRRLSRQSISRIVSLPSSSAMSPLSSSLSRSLLLSIPPEPPAVYATRLPPSKSRALSRSHEGVLALELLQWKIVRPSGAGRCMATECRVFLGQSRP